MCSLYWPSSGCDDRPPRLLRFGPLARIRKKQVGPDSAMATQQGMGADVRADKGHIMTTLDSRPEARSGAFWLCRWIRWGGGDMD
jgi:hypothetical protein